MTEVREIDIFQVVADKLRPLDNLLDVVKTDDGARSMFRVIVIVVKDGSARKTRAGEWVSSKVGNEEETNTCETS